MIHKEQDLKTERTRVIRAYQLAHLIAIDITSCCLERNLKGKEDHCSAKDNTQIRGCREAGCSTKYRAAKTLRDDGGSERK